MRNNAHLTPEGVATTCRHQITMQSLALTSQLSNGALWVTRKNGCFCFEFTWLQTRHKVNNLERMKWKGKITSSGLQAELERLQNCSISCEYTSRERVGGGCSTPPRYFPLLWCVYKLLKVSIPSRWVPKLISDSEINFKHPNYETKMASRNWTVLVCCRQFIARPSRKVKSLKRKTLRGSASLVCSTILRN